MDSFSLLKSKNPRLDSDNLRSGAVGRTSEGPTDEGQNFQGCKSSEEAWQSYEFIRELHQRARINVKFPEPKPQMEVFVFHFVKDSREIKLSSVCVCVCVFALTTGSASIYTFPSKTASLKAVISAGRKEETD